MSGIEKCSAVQGGGPISTLIERSVSGKPATSRHSPNENVSSKPHPLSPEQSPSYPSAPHDFLVLPEDEIHNMSLVLLKIRG